MPHARTLFVFVDGVGLGPPGDANPFTTARLPTFEALLDGRRPVLDGTVSADARSTDSVHGDSVHGDPAPLPADGRTHLPIGRY